ncbi:MAG: glycosyltransferase family 2 protein [Bacteroidetes bacterium]|nr:glycosyltransferase family 2 protein [Bacteroidota bacterium]
MVEISVVLPVYNEEQNLKELYARLSETLRQLTNAYEILFVNDGSNDGSLAIIKNYSSTDSRIKFISFTRNFGHQNAIAAGIQNARGNAVITMDADLQDPPELISDMHRYFTEGYKVVYARRLSRPGESSFKRFTAKAFYRLMKRITAIDIPIDTGDFRLIGREVAMKLGEMKEANKFLRGQIAWMGFTPKFIEYERPGRKHGSTKFTIKRMTRFAIDGITSFSNFPLQIATFLGFLFSIVAFILILYSLNSKYILHQVVTGWTSLMVSTMFIGGVQLLCIGIIGEYIMRINNDVKRRPSFIVEESNINDMS